MILEEMDLLEVISAGVVCGAGPVQIVGVVRWMEQNVMQL